MIISHIQLQNWRNFRDVDVDLQPRTFVIGPNASGKSNLLDAVRFLKDVAGVGLQVALERRGGLSKIRSLSAGRVPGVSLCVTLADPNSGASLWKYQLTIRREQNRPRRTLVENEQVWRPDGELVLQRPSDEEMTDPELRTQTYLEQVSRNGDFREVAVFLRSVRYLHLVPQLIRYGEEISGNLLTDDPFGQEFLRRIIDAPKKTRARRLRAINEQLQGVLPQFSDLHDARDDYGRPHLEMSYEHWRPEAALQREDQFSDGTLRLIGLLWSLMERGGPLLLEEPELSLQAAVVRQLAPMFATAAGTQGGQVLVTTHSYELLDDSGIDPSEVLVVTPTDQGSTATCAASDASVVAIAEQGQTIADVLLSMTAAPAASLQMRLPE